MPNISSRLRTSTAAVAILSSLLAAHAFAQQPDDLDYRQYTPYIGEATLPSEAEVQRYREDGSLSMPPDEAIQEQLKALRNDISRSMDSFDRSGPMPGAALKPYTGPATEEQREAYGEKLRTAQQQMADQLSNEGLNRVQGDAINDSPPTDRLQELLKEQRQANRALKNQMESGTYAVPEEALIVFVSFSMPERVLQNLSEQARAAGAVMVLRGMVDGDMRATKNAARRVNGAGAAWEINPQLFTTFDVQTVPAFVLTGDKSVIDEGCAVDAAGQCSRTNTFTKVSGDMSIELALDTIRRRTEVPFIRDLATQRLQHIKSDQR